MTLVVGADEAGYGPNLGPLVVAATAWEAATDADGVEAAFAAAMSPEALAAWGWRIPFLMGLLVGIAGWWLRRGIVETPRSAVERAPLAATLRQRMASITIA